VCVSVFVLFHSKPAKMWDADISRTMTSSGHFFSKWANFCGHLQRVTSRGHFLVNSSGHFCPKEDPFLGEFSCTLFGGNSSGHFLMVLTNGADIVGQPTQEVRGRSPC
jgi:hypothetical protein